MRPVGLPIALVFTLFFSLPLSVQAGEALDSSNLERLKSENVQTLHKVGDILKQRQSDLRFYDILFTGVPPVNNSFLEDAYIKQANDRLRVVSNHLSDVQARFDHRLEAIKLGCREYLQRQVGIVSKVTQGLIRGGVSSMKVGNANLSRKASLQTYRFYLMGLVQTFLAGGGPYLESMKSTVTCITDDSSRKSLAEGAIVAADLIQKLNIARYGIPAFTKGEGMANQVAHFFVKDTTYVRQYSKLGAKVGMTIAGMYLGVGALKALFEIGRVGIYLFTMGYGGLTTGISQFNAINSQQLNASIGTFHTLGPETMKMLEILVASPKKVTTENWYNFLAMVEDIRINEFIKNRKRINQLCSNLQCSPEQLKALASTTSRQLREVTAVLSEKASH